MLVRAKNPAGRAFPSQATFMRDGRIVNRSDQASTTPLLAAFPNPSARAVLFMQLKATSMLQWLIIHFWSVSVTASAAASTTATATASASTTSAGDRLCSFRNMRKIAMAVWTFGPRLLFFGSSAHLHGFRAARAETTYTLDYAPVIVILVVP
jgi:hypothetical protein